MSDSGICLQAFIPMRREPDERSEMVNQVLYGESFMILESSEKHGFSLIQLDHDKYTGWISKRTYHLLSEKDKKSLSTAIQYVTHNLFTLLSSRNPHNSLILGCGSTIYLIRSQIFDPKEIYYTDEKNLCTDDKNSRQVLIQSGMKLVNVPYLWGGRSSFGIDCSGLCQNLYKQVGIIIPRDSGSQSASGRTVSFLNEAEPGDLAFFDNEDGKIIHAGMLLDNKRILHASGKVRIDKIDHHGIYSDEMKAYTHKLRIIKRIIDIE